MSFGRVSREILLAHPKTNSSNFICHGTGFCGQMKLNKDLFLQETLDILFRYMALWIPSNNNRQKKNKKT